LAQAGTPYELAEGETLFLAGDADDRYFVILAGAIDIRSGERRVPLSAGDGFGEIAVLHGTPRTASATAATATTVVGIPGAAPRDALGHQPSATTATSTSSA
jgi:CRP-like cAMP-binding protein